MLRERRPERGVALLLVVVSIAILAAVAAEFAYTSRVDLELAAHERDALRAEYLARSALGTARLLLQFQKQLDVSMQALASTPGLGGAAGGFNLQLWKMMHVDCQTLGRFLPQNDPGAGLVPRAPRPRGRVEEPPAGALGAPLIDYGTFRGCYASTIDDEEARLSVSQLDSLLTAGAGRAAVQRLYLLLTDKRFEFVFEHEDANHVKLTANDAVINVKDWADADDLISTLTLVQGLPQLGPGFGDEPGLYTRYTPRYRPKNAAFDTVDELFFVHGIGDRFMAAFRDRITVYPDVNARLNVNSDDPLVLALAVRTAADPAHPDGRLTDPVFLDSVVQKLHAAQLLSPMGLTVGAFVAVLVQAGIAVNPQITSNVQANPYLGDRSKTFRVTAVGEAGDLLRTVTAVVRLERPEDGLGTLLYWKEE
ncbi:MAG TPA: type II secretion system minor pseudopilin GspK [Myxococcaceae bacterium]|nr:type II secretion system minor pseudopilin GspK [Myxococcaceae bacterium]